MDLHHTEKIHTKNIQLVNFSIGEEVFGLHIGEVQEIIRIKEFMQLPLTEDYIKGMTNLRNKLIPIIDMRLKFKMESVDYSDLTRVIIVKMNESPIGLVVDSVSNILNLPEQKIEEPPEVYHGLSNKFIRGIGKAEKNDIIILKVDEVLTADEIEMLIKKARKTKKKKVKASAKKMKAAGKTKKKITKAKKKKRAEAVKKKRVKRKKTVKKG